MMPTQLRPNLIDHFYAGGAKIAALRGIATTSARQPEEWIASTVARAGETRIGLATTADGDVLRDLVTADPRAWLGSPEASPDTGLLVKLLDAGQRLPVHAHPDRSFARQHLDCAHGKTEAWLVLDATGDGAVYLGWKDDVDPTDLAAARDAQDNEWMLSRLHRVAVRRGDGILVPAGTPHAIGEGTFVAEVQEPTDFSIVLEWSLTTSTRDESHLGLGFDLAMQAVDTAQLSAQRLSSLIVHTDLDGYHDTVVPLLPSESDAFFRLDLLCGGIRETLSAGFAAVLVLSGRGRLLGDGTINVQAGDALAVPAGFGEWRADGNTRILVARPAAGREVPHV
ncbi:class I mannose-6-phosphate isomerase [Aeromicrobium sp.]|uniref:class I mannose-6-phosphate isomerase n=1 Tax=Aeromicrobium sp. TaxID=1871063 RepID=UPI002FC815E7